LPVRYRSGGMENVTYYFYQMNPQLNSNIIAFFEKIEKYYGCKTEITEGLYSKLEDLDANLTTWNLSEFELIRSKKW